MKTNFLSAIALTAAPFLLGADVAAAKTIILEVGGGSNGTAFGPTVKEAGAATEFTVNSDMTGVTFTAPISCFGTCEAIFEIASEIGTSASALSLVARTDLTSSDQRLTFENLSLNVGTYYGVLYVKTGFATWAANDAQGGTGNGAATDGGDFLMTTPNVGTPFRSAFSATDLSYHYSLIDPAPIPLPASAWLLGAGLLSLTRRAKRK